jgi:pimeloyl-ACP methyl ester carboxylesterase
VFRAEYVAGYVQTVPATRADLSQALHVVEAGEGLPVVLLHAFPVSSTMWLTQREELAGVCRIITPDLRGFGGSKLPAGSGTGIDERAPSVDDMAADVAALLDARGIERAVIGGLSMGGYVTMSFLRQHPDRVQAVILADTKATADPEPARANRLRIADTALAEWSPRVVVDEVAPNLLGRTTAADRPGLVARVLELAAQADPAAIAWAQRAMAARPDSFQTLAGAQAPALVIVGEEDTLASVEDARAMVDVMADARLVTIPEAGHLSAMEQPEAFTEAVREFLFVL